MKTVELAIIGGGIAGISCAVYAKRAGLSPVIFERSSLGGQLLYIDSIDNYPGVALNTKGAGLLKTLTDTVRELNVEVVETEIKSLKVAAGRPVVLTESGDHESAAAVIATGAVFSKLGVEGEEEFTGKGVSWCAVCDGYFFKNKTAAVVGGGNTAAEDAIYLSSLCKKVYLIHRRDQLRALDYLQKELFAKDNIEVILNSRIKAIEGGRFLEAIILESDKKESTLSVNGLFIAVGVKPNTELCRGVIDMDEGGFIVTDQVMKTSRDYFYACGDCRRRPLRQLVTAAAEGATAALSAYQRLRGSYVSY
ncbi:MAG: FAD-dependent oxidoreductase [Candidatus Omnitrophota bacterium]